MKILKRTYEAPVVTEYDYRGSLVDLVRAPKLIGIDGLYVESRSRKSPRKVIALIWHTMFTWMLSMTAAGAIIGLGYRTFIVLNSGQRIIEDSSAMYAFGTTLFMYSSFGATAAGVVGIAAGLLAGIVLSFMRHDLSDDRAS